LEYAYPRFVRQTEIVKHMLAYIEVMAGVHEWSGMKTERRVAYVTSEITVTSVRNIHVRQVLAADSGPLLHVVRHCRVDSKTLFVL
jgi:hypothetical protein